MKYTISPQIADILLKAARDGMLNLNDLSHSSTTAPPIYYAECAKGIDGAITWKVIHLPIIDPYVWKRYCAATHRDSCIRLTKEERSSIIKACMYGEADGESLSRIFPIERKPMIASIFYRGFQKGKNNRPAMPDWIMERYSTMIHPYDRDFGICASFIDDPAEYPQCHDSHPIDLSNGHPIDPNDAPLFDMLAIGLIFYCR